MLAIHRKLLSVDAASNSSALVVHRSRGSDESSWYDAMFEKIDSRLDLLIQQLVPSRAPADDDRLRSITYDHFDTSATDSCDADITNVDECTYFLSASSANDESTDKGVFASVYHGAESLDRQCMEEGSIYT